MLVAERDAIRANYVRSHSVLFEAFCCMPWDLLGLHPDWKMRAFMLARLAKLPRLVVHIVPNMDLVERPQESSTCGGA